MATDNEDRLADLLADDWTIAGYSVCLMAAGATSHHTLLRKDTRLKNVVIVMNKGEELGRDVFTLSPAPPKKKGWFG